MLYYLQQTLFIVNSNSAILLVNIINKTHIEIIIILKKFL